MRIGFIVNDIETEEAGYTTTRLAMAALNLGHEMWEIGVGDLAYDADDRVRAHARTAPEKEYQDTESFLSDLQGKKARVERITVDDLDVLMLRSDPAADTASRPWAQTAGLLFAQAAARRGVIVLNDPHTLAHASNKLYFQLFPEEVRPRTLITRDREDIRQFFEEQNHSMILKPLQGSGGQSVFLVNPDDIANLNQMVEAISRDGYVVAQEYLAAAAEGDIRLFVMNGEPLQQRGKYAAFRRISTSGDLRSNLHAGGKLARAEIDEDVLKVAEIVRPKLIQDGMFLVGLDIVGDKLMEVNVFSPGGLGSAQKLERTDFTHAVIQAIERKVQYRAYCQGKIENQTIATL
jgi:glutathione synthase